MERASQDVVHYLSPILLFSTLNKNFCGYSDAENVFLDNENTQLSRWPDQYFDYYKTSVHLPPSASVVANILITVPGKLFILIIINMYFWDQSIQVNILFKFEARRTEPPPFQWFWFPSFMKSVFWRCDPINILSVYRKNEKTVKQKHCSGRGTVILFSKPSHIFFYTSVLDILCFYNSTN